MKYTLSKENKIALLRALQCGKLDSEIFPKDFKGETWKVEIVDTSMQANCLNREKLVNEVRRLQENRLNGDLIEWMNYLNDCFTMTVKTARGTSKVKQMQVVKRQLAEFYSFVVDWLERYSGN